MRNAWDGAPSASAVPKNRHEPRPATVKRSSMPWRRATSMTPCRRRSPRACSVSITGSSRYVAIVAIPAARPTCSAPCVVERRKTRSRSWSRPPSCMISRLPASADSANPLAIPLPHVERSGVIPCTSCAPPVCQRNPLTFSSKTRSAPSARTSSCSAAQESLARRRRPLGLEDEARDLVRDASRAAPRPMRGRRSGTSASAPRRPPGCRHARA